MTTIPAARLQVGDLLPLPESPPQDLRTIEVVSLRTLRSGRIAVWVRTSGVPAKARSWNYGVFQPTATVERIEVA